MSMVSAACAEYANQVKKKWEMELRAAYEARAWESVAALIDKLQKFYFGE